MTLDDFLSTLAAQGLARVAPDELEPPDGPLLAERLGRMHQRAALELAGTAPGLELDAARDGARWLYRLAAGICAGRGPATAHRWAPPVAPPTPAAAFSADLGLRWLSDLERLALGLAVDDPRRKCLREVARAYPLSSVGVRDLGPLAPGALIEHSGLARLYVDRCLARGAPERLEPPLLAELARAATPPRGPKTGPPQAGSA